MRTLLVGDEPRDIVFAGPERSRAFITTAHRGQNIPFDPQLTTPGVGRADVWVFDADELGGASGNTLGGTPLTIVTLFTDTPRALAVTPDGSRVYAAGFHTGNQTTIVPETSLPDGFGPDGAPGPHHQRRWPPGARDRRHRQVERRALGRRARPLPDQYVRLSLPDKDVFVIDAMADPPRQLAGAGGVFQGVGTILFNMAVNPVSGRSTSPTPRRTTLRGSRGRAPSPGESLRGHLHESRITVLSPGGGVAPRHLNKHIDYDTCCAPARTPRTPAASPCPRAWR